MKNFPTEPAHTSVPCLPENAPFTAEQRAYLNGFFAGLFSRASPTPSAEAPKTPLTILYGSQTGNAENLAKRLGKEAARKGFAPTVYEMAQYPTASLPRETRLLLITSTYGDGDPPDNAKTFLEFLNSPGTPTLPSLKFSVFALGDSNYAKFCECGKNFDAGFAKLGAQRIADRADADVDFEAAFVAWMNAVLGEPDPTNAPRFQVPETPMASTHSRTNPFPAPVICNRNLNTTGSAKETRHVEFSLAGSGLTYEAGDALGVFPQNCPALVQETLKALGDDTLADALLRKYDITKISTSLLRFYAERTGDPELQKVAAPDANGEASRFLRGREVIDLLLAFPQVKPNPQEFVKLLKPLQPRLYSIASSPKAHPDQVHLTVGVVRYHSLERSRKGVCSTFLAERVSAPVNIFIHHNKNFRPPADPEQPMIMVGPGTGIAPFRGFLHERQATGAKGRNWLFFGDQHAASDFLYRDELEQFFRDGLLTRLNTAFSRDQADKVYVQHHMLKHAQELFAWLEEGASFFVCGDASRMAKDVDQALHEVVQQRKNCSAEAADEYVKQLKLQKRYLRDVY